MTNEFTKLQSAEEMLARWADGYSCGCDVSVGHMCELCHDMQVVHWLLRERDAWRAACRYLYDVSGEGGSKGRPMDLISRGAWKQAVGLISAAEAIAERGER